MRRTVQRPVKNVVAPIIHTPIVSAIPVNEGKALESAIVEASPSALAASTQEVPYSVSVVNAEGLTLSQERAAQEKAEYIPNEGDEHFKAVFGQEVYDIAREAVTEAASTDDALTLATQWNQESAQSGMGMVKVHTLFAHRSGRETYWACPRKFYLNYLHCGTGIVKSPTKLQLSVGSAVHIGLGVLLWECKANNQVSTQQHIHDAIYAALDYFRATDTFKWLKDEEKVEQLNLITGLLFSFYYYRWPTFSAQFEILTVEKDFVEEVSVSDTLKVVISSRPDAIVRDRSTNEIVVISWKTCDNIADYKRINYHQNLQVYLEGHYGERVLQRYLDEEYQPQIPEGLKGKALMQFMAQQSAEFEKLPRKVDYTLTIFLVKGARTAQLKDGEDITLDEAETWQEQDKTYRQQSFLCYQWFNLEGHERAWSFRHYALGNKGYSNLKGDWAQVPVVTPAVWEESEEAAITAIGEWVKSLVDGCVFPSTLEDPRNEINPLKRVIVDDEPEYHDAERAARVQQVFARESCEIAEKSNLMVGPAGAWIDTAPQQYAKFLDEHFPQHLIACNNSAPAAGVPVRCEYKGMCLNGDELIQIAPGVMSEGMWSRRTPHHEVELGEFKRDGRAI